MYQYDGKIFAEEEDLCMNCVSATSETKLCPLMRALSVIDVAICSGSMIIEECDFYLPTEEKSDNN